MKILYLAPMELPVPSEKGAVEEIIWQLSRRMKKIADVYIYNPISINNFHKFAKGLKLFTYKSNHECIIHSHNLYASLALSLNNTRLKHLLALHYPPCITKSEQRRKIYRIILKYLDTSGTLITAPSLYITKEIESWNISRAIFIPNGVDTTIFNPLKRSEELREKILEGKDTLIVNVGRIHPDKNQLALIMAIDKLVNYYGYKNIKLVLVGPTSGAYGKAKENSYFRLLTRYINNHKLKPYVSFIELPRREVATLLASSDIYVHPSKVEAAPLAILEALASKLPVVAFDLPYYKGYLINGLNSILVPNNISCLANSLRILLEDHNLELRISQNAYNIATKYFSWDFVSQFYERLYQSILSYK
jgi:glycosyltransferase involved in cell wall biosynthesis